MIQRIRHKRSNPAFRRTLGVLVIFWLNLAAMPCTMALETGDASAHCPPMSEQAMSHMDHQADKAEIDCLSMQSDCCSVAQTTMDNRGGAEKCQKDTSAVIVGTPAWPLLQTFAVSTHEAMPPDPGTCFPPLHVLNCVYLD